MSKKSNHRNTVLTTLHTQCRLCHYAGVSNKCDFHDGNTCAPADAKKEIRRNSKQTG